MGSWIWDHWHYTLSKISRLRIRLVIILIERNEQLQVFNYISLFVNQSNTVHTAIHDNYDFRLKFECQRTSEPDFQSSESFQSQLIANMPCLLTEFIVQHVNGRANYFSALNKKFNSKTTATHNRTLISFKFLKQIRNCPLLVTLTFSLFPF